MLIIKDAYFILQSVDFTATNVDFLLVLIAITI